MPTFTALKDSDVFHTKIERVVKSKTLLYSKMVFAKSVAKFNGRIRYAPQHAMIWAALDCIVENGGDPPDWLRAHLSGLCSGLASEWIICHALGRNLVSTVNWTTNSLLYNGTHVIDDIKSFIDDVIYAQHHQSRSQLRERFSRVSCFQTGKFVSQYPFANLDKKHPHQRLRNSRYYYFGRSGHAMAAYVDENGFLDFYDPNIGQATGLSSTDFLPMYFKNRVDIELAAKIVHPVKTLHPTKILKLAGKERNVTHIVTEYERRVSKH